MSEIERFLASYPPFNGISREDLGAVASALQVEFFPSGTIILHKLGTPAEFLFVVRTGSVEVVGDGQIMDVLEEGEMFGYPSLLSGAGPAMTVRAAEDTLCYLVDRELAQKLLGSPSGLTFFANSLRQWLDRAVGSRDEGIADPRLVRVGSLVTRPPLVCEPGTTVREAAELMAHERASSVLVRTDRGFGILTDRDLRSKVVAQGLPYDRPIGEVMTFPARTIGADRLVHEALLQMIEEGIHHLPVLDGTGGLTGVITDTDILGLERRRPFVIRSEVERARDPAEVAAAARGLTRSVATLVRAGLDPVDVGHVVAVTIDAITRRLIALTVDRLGTPPAPWAWLALGSEARREQALGTDQDHAMAYADGAEEHDDYFRRLAESVVEGLEAGGIPRCRSGVLASEAPWRRTVQGWTRTFEEWMTASRPEPVALTTIGFDYRQIAGPMEVEEPLDRTVRSAKDRPAFLRRLARTALDFKPPTGFRGNLVVHRGSERSGSLDIKRGGLLPITDLARLFALQAGSGAKATLERLEAAAGSGVLEGDPADALEEAYRVILDVRVSSQAAKVEAGAVADNLVDIGALGRIDRARLKDAFRVITEVQRQVSRRFGLTRVIR